MATSNTAFTHNRMRNFVLAAIFSALIVVMTVVPMTGYITVGPVEMTTLHIIVSLGAILLGWKYGALFGFVWGLTCVIRAFTNPLWIMFTNPLISLVPRVIVGAVAGLVFTALGKTKLPALLRAVIAAAAATLTNTVLVLSSMYIFGGMIASYREFFELFKTIFATVISLNGSVELAAAIIITPLIYKVVAPVWNKRTAKEDK